MSAAAQFPPRDHIFISYRRDDARGASGRIYDWLRIGFGRERVFRDVHSIGVGKWREKIDAALAKSAVCVAVIGPRWSNDENLPRLRDENDMVRHELITSLCSRTITMVPTLVEGVEVKDLESANLPAELRPLLEVWNVRSVTEDGWEDDIRRLIAEISETSGLPVGPDLDSLLRTAAAAQARAAELETARQLQSDQIEALHRTVDELRSKLAEASVAERPGLARAFAELARGNSLAAENAFEREYEAQEKAQFDARKARADAARNVANLALLRDVSKAVVFYQKALDAEPAAAETARMLGNAFILAGDLKGAEAAFSKSLRIAGEQDDRWTEIAALVGLGDVLQTSTDLSSAENAYRRALSTVEKCLAADPENLQWQRELSVVHERIGNMLVAQGDVPGALAAYRLGLKLREALASRLMANTELQRDLSVIYVRIGNMLLAQGDKPGALTSYRQALAIHKVLAEQDPASSLAQRDLSVSHNKIGDVLLAQDDVAGALAEFRKDLEIAEALAAHDRANTQWQRDLSVSYNKIGNILVAQRDWPAALAIYYKDLEISQALVARDSVNTGWQRDLSVTHQKIGNVLAAQDDEQGALAAYHEAIGILGGLVVRDPTNAQWQKDMASLFGKLGKLPRVHTKEARRDLFRRGREILLTLKSSGRLTTSQDWITWFDDQLAELDNGGK